MKKLMIAAAVAASFLSVGAQATTAGAGSTITETIQVRANVPFSDFVLFPKGWDFGDVQEMQVASDLSAFETLTLPIDVSAPDTLVLQAYLENIPQLRGLNGAPSYDLQVSSTAPSFPDVAIEYNAPVQITDAFAGAAVEVDLSIASVATNPEAGSYQGQVDIVFELADAP